MRPNQPSDVHEVAVCVAVDAVVLKGGSSPSRQPPNQPGYRQDVLVAIDDVVVSVGAGAGAGVADCVLCLSVVVSSSSLHPNQPGVLQVELEVVCVVVL